MSAPFLEFDLDREIEQLHREPEWQTGQNARTLVKYDDFRIVLTALKAHVRISAHHTEGRISISTLRGHIRTNASDRTFDLPVGSLLALGRDVSHDVEALEDSAFLLTIARPVKGRGAAA
jgi:quercetin dioxygenase-like cupin family protein